MSGRWTRLWDDTRKEWVNVYIEDSLASPIGRGSVTTLQPEAKTVLLGRNGKPLFPATPTHRPLGFRKP